MESDETFVRQSGRSARSHSTCGLSSSPYKLHHFPLSPPVRHSFSNRPVLIPFEPLLTLFPSLFEPCPTVYKVALLNWKPQLCRSYRTLLFPPLSFLPIEPCPFPLPPHDSSSSSNLGCPACSGDGSAVIQLTLGVGWIYWPGFFKFLSLSLSLEEVALDQTRVGIWCPGGKFVCLLFQSMGITIVSRGFCGFLISSSSFLARLVSRVSFYCFLFLLFFYSSLFFPFFFNIVMDVEEREKRERERGDFAQRLGW